MNERRQTTVSGALCVEQVPVHSGLRPKHFDSVSRELRSGIHVRDFTVVKKNARGNLFGQLFEPSKRVGTSRKRFPFAYKSGGKIRMGVAPIRCDFGFSASTKAQGDRRVQVVRSAVA